MFRLLSGDRGFPKVCEYERRRGACMGIASGGATIERRRRIFSETLHIALFDREYFDDEENVARLSGVRAIVARVFRIPGRRTDGG